MTLAVFTIITLSLFMIHEFDEIILIRPWIEQNQHDLRLQQELFIAKKASYPSTEATAFLIAEEFFIAFLILLAALVWHIPELAVSLTLCHTLHLLAHITQVVRFRRWVPGGFTAVTTFPLLCLSLLLYLCKYSCNYLILALLTSILMLTILGNLVFLHKKAPRLHAWIYRFTKEK